MSTDIWYSIENMGDGSAEPRFFWSERLARWHQDHLMEGWGEPCVGKITIESDGPIRVSDVQDPVEFWLYATQDEDFEPWEYRDEFLAEFFPNGLPAFEVWIFGKPGGQYYIIEVDDVEKGRRFAWDRKTQRNEATEEGRKALEERLNKREERV